MKSVAAYIATHRYGLGPRPGEADLAADDPRGWLADQVRPLRPLLTSAMGSAELIAAYRTAQRTMEPAPRRAVLKELNAKGFQNGALERSVGMIRSEVPFAERLVAFWSNHFTVSRVRPIIGPAIPAYENEAIRPHVFGRFAEMLRAVVSHPCMIVYLDNVSSVGPDSVAAQRRRKAGKIPPNLNENLARELLELHTLGVDGGYDQADVIELAKALTGWGWENNDESARRGEVRFFPARHQPGPKTVLGKTYPEAGEDEMFAILDDLARHPATARHLAVRLVRHFVADDPPEAEVETIARVFRDSDGDLAEVSRALVTLEAAWREPATKVKSHHDLVIAAHRVTGNESFTLRNILLPMRELGQMPFSAPSPEGWGDRTEDWLSPEALMRRIEWLRRFSGTLPPTLRPDVLLDDAVGPIVNDATRLWVSRAPSGDAGIAMVLASPEFQRR